MRTGWVVTLLLVVLTAEMTRSWPQYGGGGAAPSTDQQLHEALAGGGSEQQQQQQQQGGDTEVLTEDFKFEQAPDCSKNYACAPWQICINGEIDTSGVGQLNLRSPVPVPKENTAVLCAGIGKICCLIPGLTADVQVESGGGGGIIEGGVTGGGGGIIEGISDGGGGIIEGGGTSGSGGIIEEGGFSGGGGTSGSGGIIEGGISGGGGIIEGGGTSEGGYSGGGGSTVVEATGGTAHSSGGSGSIVEEESSGGLEQQQSGGKPGVPVLPGQCVDGYECVSTYLCHDGKIITSGEGLLDKRIGGKPISCVNPEYPTVPSVCCQYPSCKAGDTCVASGACTGTHATDETGKYQDCFVGANLEPGVCCTPPKPPAPLQTCPGTKICVTQNLCTSYGNLLTDGTGNIDIRLHSICYLGKDDPNGVCCEPPKPLTTCPGDGTSVCVPSGTCSGQVTQSAAGDSQACYLEGSTTEVGQCCTPPPPLTTCPGEETCLVADLCYTADKKPSPSNSPCYVNPNIVGVCCYPAPPPTVPVLDTCPDNSVCLPDILCQGDILNEAGAYVSHSSGGKWSQCLLSGTGLAVPGVCCRNPTPPTPDTSYPAADKCGVHNIALDTRIQNKDLKYYQTTFAEFPWQAIIFFSNFTFKCGASLIGDRWLLTAAHCVKDLPVNDLRVRLGEWQVDQYKEPLQYYDANVASIKIHPLFNPKNVHNGIAVVELSVPVVFQYHINTICLPNKGQIFPKGTRCFATGWGKDAFDGGKYQVILKKVEVPVVPNPECQGLLRKTRLGKFFILDKSFMCAGGEEKKDACEGDGGGPLACQDQTTGDYVLTGITAWGIGCGQKDVPGVYVDVQYFREWLDGIINQQDGQQQQQQSSGGYSGK
ncbi:inactive serine protease scarface isoform X2 [Cherax quadricarinatus]|uniref:inactive serine protease scarface isoform X2 n=1 Tax=Cherax quadricarinatus TaxID=27406 RepID=UPI00387E9008